MSCVSAGSRLEDSRTRELENSRLSRVGGSIDFEVELVSCFVMP